MIKKALILSGHMDSKVIEADEVIVRAGSTIIGCEITTRRFVVEVSKSNPSTLTDNSLIGCDFTFVEAEKLAEDVTVERAR